MEMISEVTDTALCVLFLAVNNEFHISYEGKVAKFPCSQRSNDVVFNFFLLHVFFKCKCLHSSSDVVYFCSCFSLIYLSDENKAVFPHILFQVIPSCLCLTFLNFHEFFAVFMWKYHFQRLPLSCHFSAIFCHFSAIFFFVFSFPTYLNISSSILRLTIKLDRVKLIQS